MSQNSEETSGISQSDMQFFMRTMQNMCEQYRENWKKTKEHFERMNKQMDEHFEDVKQNLETVHENLRESLEIVHESMEQSVRKLSNIIETTRQEIRQINLDTCEKDDTKEIEEEDVERSNERQAEVSERLSEQVAEILETEGIPATEIRETKETDGNSSMETSQEISERQGEPDAPNQQSMNEKVAGGTNKEPRKRRVGSWTAAGARRKKRKSTRLKKKWELQRKTMHGKSQKEAFQAWMDQVCKKPQQQTTEMQRHVPWDPGGFISKNRSSQVPDHRSQSPSLIATSTLMEATD
jgi:hypothetical protein